MLSPDEIRRDGIFDVRTVDSLIRKFKSQVPTSTGDNMALVGILSTEIVLERFMACGSSRSAIYETQAP